MEQWKTRIVFQVSNVRAKTCMSAADFFEEVSSARASFAAARAALAVAAMSGFSGIPRNAKMAELQAPSDTPTRTPTVVELPQECWPDTWSHDSAARTQPKYVRPHCRLLRALYGHPDAGALWEATLIDIMKNQWWTAITGNGSVFLHGTTRAIMVAYADDMFLLAKPRDAGPLWRSLEKAVMLKDVELPLTRYLGAR